MSRPRGSIIGARPTWTTTATSGIWTLRQAEEMQAANQWPRGPEAPTSLAGTAGDEEVALTWTAPATTHGTITDYVVEYTPAAGSPTVVATGSTAASYTLTGLTNATEYTFRVAGVNHTRGDFSDSVAVTPSVPFNPATIASLELWMDASDASTLYDATSGGSLVAADGQVARWEDKSGNARHATQSISGNQPLRKLSAVNGLTAVLFNGTTTRMLYSQPSPAPENATVFAVVERKTIAGAASYNGVVAFGDSFAIYSKLANGQWGVYNVGGSADNGSGVATQIDETTVLTVKRTAANRFLYTNGTLSATVAGDGSMAYTQGVIGADSDTTQIHPGHICEIIAYSANLSDVDRGNVETYLKAKWGVA